MPAVEGQTGHASDVTAFTAGMIIYWKNSVATIPSGWVESTTIRGRTIVGLPASGTLAGTVGTALTDLQDITHTHTGPSHTHTGPSHTHAQSSTGSATNNNNVIVVLANADIDSNMYTAGGSTTGSAPVMRSGVAAGGTGATGAEGTGATGTNSAAAHLPFIHYPAIEKS